MRRAFVFALLLLSCKDGPSQSANCSGGEPDFDILITALNAPLPADMVVHVAYAGGAMDQYVLSNPGKTFVLFCKPSDREGNLVPGSGGQGGQPAETELSGAGGDDGAPGHPIEGLRCQLWSQGPATMTIETSKYPVKPHQLSGKAGKCTVPYEFELGPDDGGS